MEADSIWEIRRFPKSSKTVVPLINKHNSLIWSTAFNALSSKVTGTD